MKHDRGKDNHNHMRVLSERLSALKRSHILIALASLAWLIIRSGRKPSRLAYPCQQTAASLVFTSLGVLLIILSRRIREFVSEKVLPRFGIRNICIVLVSIAVIASSINQYQIRRSWRKYELTKQTGTIGIRSNQRDSRGGIIYQTIPAAMLLPSPHRVVSIHSSEATGWTGSGSPHNYINQNEVNKMVREGILRLTRETDYVQAWQSLIPYQPGEVVAIKLNCNNKANFSDDDMNPYAELVNAVIDGLVGMGVPAGNIWLVDPSRGIGSDWQQRITNQGVVFTPNHGHVPADSPYASIADFVREGPTPVRPAEVYIESAHIINMPQLKGHGGASISLGLKNHFGSAIIGAQNRSYWHDYIYVNRETYGTNGINAILAINLNPQFVNKTRLIIGDGLYGHPRTNGSPPELFRSFGNNPPEILFFGVDPVATDSVMFDYLQRECSAIGIGARVDDLHHDAALSGLGVTEHWDGDDTRRYSTIDYVEIDFDDTTPPQPPNIELGDVTGDGEINVLDVLLAARHAVGLTNLQGDALRRANVNGDVDGSGQAKIDILDIILIARRAIGL